MVESKPGDEVDEQVVELPELTLLRECAVRGHLTDLDARFSRDIAGPAGFTGSIGHSSCIVGRDGCLDRRLKLGARLRRSYERFHPEDVRVIAWHRIVTIASTFLGARDCGFIEACLRTIYLRDLSGWSHSDSEWRHLERRQLLWHASISLPLTQYLPWLAISRTAMQINHEQLALQLALPAPGAARDSASLLAVGDRAPRVMPAAVNQL